MEKVLLSVAPVSAADNDVEPRRVAADVLDCVKAGAGMVHLHVRDRKGRLTDDLTDFRETLRLIRAKSDVVIEASTGGISGLDIRQRCAPLSLPEVECASLNVGSVNLGDAVYVNTPADVEFCAGEILRTGKTPDIEVFEIGMIASALKLCEKLPFTKPLLFSIVLGHRGAAPPIIEALTVLRSFIPQDMLWGITHYGRQSNDLIAAAVAMGASVVRVGFEDSAVLDCGCSAASNAPIIERFAGLLRALGKEPMSPAEARALLRI
ncbi:MAG: 3-keto-5-aminohexanoate cleavage protein [Oscillospiraceae bacterium]|nr:3-keto-5-aminohexanoate cleavage protein [Oscillospiraceae bacterium]